MRPPASKLTRRSFIGGTLSACALTACGSSATTQGTGEDHDAGSPVTITHKHGSTEIPAPPRRIVTVGLTEQDYVLALGVTPVGVREWFGQHPGALWPWARDKVGDGSLPEVLPRQELNFEQIATLHPDVILGVNSGLTRSEYETLSRIAPTVAQPRAYADYGVPWQEMTKTIGRAMGRSKQARALIPEIEKGFKRARAGHPAFDGATGLLATSIDGVAYIYAEGPAPEFLRSLGLEMPPAAAKLFTGDDRAPVKLSQEKLRVLEADVLVLGIYGSKQTSVAREPLYQKLDVAREGRDVLLPQQSVLNGALSFGSVLSLPVALDHLVPRLAKAIDGDPATKVKPVT